MLTPPDDVLARRAVRRLGSSLCGRYTLRHVIGIGGMAAVYAGVHRNGHAVAIKILHERLASDPEIERLFRREAQLANKIDHPGVVPVIDDDVTDDGCVFLVMPLLEGETVRARAERSERKLALGELLTLSHAILETLRAAHEKRIVHRDIKPENVFVTTDGDVRVLDFGIGRFFEVAESVSATRSGRALGTPAFMAPEQALGRLREVDGRTDLWALGATMFSLLTGRFVHDADSPAELAVLAATRPAPRLDELAPEVPEAVRQVIDRALMFRKEERWHDAGAMDQALQGASEAALGMPIGDLPRVVAPQSPKAQDLDGIPTRPPQSADQASYESTHNVEPGFERHRAGIVFPAPETSTGLFRTAETRTHALPSRPLNLSRRWWLPALVALAAIGTGYGVVRRAAFSSHANQKESAGEEALQHYRSGLDSWHDQRRSDPDFLSALALDPRLAAAHLALAVLPRFPTADAFLHFADAVKGRATMSEADLALLDAVEPAMRVPDDLNEARRRLEPLAKRYTGDFRFTHALGSILMRLGDGSAMLRVADSAIRADPTAGTSWSIQALGYDLLGDVPKARDSFEQCISHAHLATNCVAMLASLEANEGRCERVEELAQNLLASGDRSPETFDLLANGVFGHSNDPTMLENVLKRAWRTAEPAIPEIVQVEEKLAQSVLAGDFERALSVARDLERLAASRDSILERLPAAEYTIELANELGRPDDAANRALAFATEKAALDSHPQLDVSLVLDEQLVGNGAIDRAEFGRRRDAWVSRQAPRFANRYGGFTFVWLYAYGFPSHTHDDALEALAHMGEYLPITDPLNRSAYRDEAIGRVYLLADKPQEAAPFLEKAARSCTAMVRPFEHTRAMLELGIADARIGANKNACTALSRAIGAWGRDTRSVTVQKALQLSATLHCSKEIGHEQEHTQ